MWLLYAVLLLLFTFLLDYFLADQRAIELCRQFNGPRRFPIIGSAYIFLGATSKGYYSFAKSLIEKYLRTKPNVGYIWEFSSLEIMTDDYKIMENMLTNPKFLAKSSQYSFMQAAFGEGLLFSSDQKWFDRRRIITPTFHFKILEQFFEVFQKQNKNLIERIRSEQNGQPFNIFPVIVQSVIKSLCETAMGYELKESDSEYFNAVQQFAIIIVGRFLKPWQKNDFVFKLTGANKRFDKYAKIMRDFTTKLIEERRKVLLNKAEDLEHLDDEDVGLKKKMCLLDVLLQSTIDNKPLSNEDIQEEVDTFTFAGHDTTTNAICFTLYMIAKHPEVQEKLNKEIHEILGNAEVTFKSLNEFKYLELVIKESLRLYPPVPVIGRRLFEEVDFGDFVAPANANYNLFLYTAYRNPEIFEKPDVFIPERFLKDVPAFAFIPFSAGQRNCIGQKFAMINIKTNIINILRNFTIIDAGIDPKIDIKITIKCDSLLIGFQCKTTTKLESEPK